MLPNMNLSEAKRESITPGGYVVEILDVKIDQTYNRLQLKVDICEGPHAGYYQRLDDRYGFWGLIINLYMDEKSRWRFANTIETIRQSNEAFAWNDDGENDERALIGQKVGVVTRMRHYLGNNGKEKTSMQVYKTVPLQDIRVGNFQIPDDVYADELKNAAPAPGGVVDTTGSGTGFGPVSDDDVPF